MDKKGNTRQGKARQGKARQGKARQGKCKIYRHLLTGESNNGNTSESAMVHLGSRDVG